MLLLPALGGLAAASRAAAIAPWPGSIVPGIAIAALVQYADVLPVLLKQIARDRDYAFAQHPSRGIIRGPEAYASRAVLAGRWKLVVYAPAGPEIRNGPAGGALLESWTG